MITNSLYTLRDFLHAQLCYQLFITPIHLPIEKQYKDFARRACEYLQSARTEIIHSNIPRHHVIHRFAQINPKAKKVLISHGWMSRAAYMARLIRSLHKKGFDVYALDFPAHGEAKGLQLPWMDAVKILKQTLNNEGPFYAVIGHSFGGSMLLNTLNLASQFPEWQIHSEPERVVLLASPTRMRSPVKRLAKQLKLSAKGFLLLRQIFRQQTVIDLRRLDFRHFVAASKTPFLCVHGQDDNAIRPIESIIFCQQHSKASLALLPGVDHINILIDERVERTVCNFLA